MRTFAAPAALLLAGSLVLSGCSLVSGDDKPSSTSTSTAATTLKNTSWTKADRADVAQGGTLRLGATAIPSNFNPAHPDAVNSDAARILAPTGGGAIRITSTGGWRVDHDYAESVEVADTDPLKIEVKLNPRAVWQGGTSITAADMVAYWKAQNGSDDDYEVASTDGYDDIESVEQGDTKFDYTVTFKTPNAEWPLYVYPHLAANVSKSPKLFNRGFRDPGDLVQRPLHRHVDRHPQGHRRRAAQPPLVGREAQAVPDHVPGRHAGSPGQGPRRR